MAAWSCLLLTAWGALCTLAAYSRGRRPPQAGALYFILAWPVAEWPLHHLVLSWLVTAGFSAQGVLDHPAGWAGLVLVAASSAVLLALHARMRGAQPALDRALQDGLGTHFFDAIRPEHARRLKVGAPLSAWINPFSLHDRGGVERLRDIAYGPGGRRQRLDVYRPREPGTGRPVLLQVHGGAWVFGRKDNQGLPLMNEMVRQGWVCIALNYRLSPKATFPDHLIDCKLALRWIREHVAEHGGDPAFVAVTGGSAGGHLAALVALTANDPRYQPGFEDVDTSVVAAVPFYGAYDFLEHNGVRVETVRNPGFVGKWVMKSSPRDAPLDWQRASPIRQVHADAPPFFLLHGTHDSLVWVENGRRFVQALRAASRQPVAWAEIPGAQHAFDILQSMRCVHAVNAVATFLAWVRSTRA